MPGTNIAKVAGRYTKRNTLLITGGGGKIAFEVIHHLRYNPSPVNRIDRAYFLCGLEGGIIRDSLDYVLTVVKYPLDCNIKNIRVLQAEHLRTLECAHFLMR